MGERAGKRGRYRAGEGERDIDRAGKRESRRESGVERECGREREWG